MKAVLEWVIYIIVSTLISAVINGCVSERDRAETDRKIGHTESRFERRFDDIRRRRDEGDRDVRPFPFRPGSGPIGAEPAAAAPEPAASSAVGESGEGRVTLKLESGL